MLCLLCGGKPVRAVGSVTIPHLRWRAQPYPSSPSPGRRRRTFPILEARRRSCESSRWRTAPSQALETTLLVRACVAEAIRSAPNKNLGRRGDLALPFPACVGTTNEALRYRVYAPRRLSKSCLLCRC